jgi:hypothetical protein
VSHQYLVDYLMEVGPTMPGGFGPAPLSYSELRAWQDTMGIQLTPWEAQTLRRLSTTWIVSSRAAEAPDCPPPYAYQRPSRAAVAKKIDLAFG